MEGRGGGKVGRWSGKCRGKEGRDEGKMRRN